MYKSGLIRGFSFKEMNRPAATINLLVKRVLWIPVILLCMFYNTGCTNDPEEIKKLGENENYALLTSVGIEVVYTDSAIRKARMKAPVLQEFGGNEPYSELPYGVEVEFFDETGKVNSELTARYAIHRRLRDEMEARYNVVVINKKGEKLHTEKLIWDNRQKRLRTDAFVRITTADEVLYGEGLEANEDFTWHKILRPQGSFQIRDAGTALP
jgi:LPS export ABC transporter protein LptC